MDILPQPRGSRYRVLSDPRRPVPSRSGSPTSPYRAKGRLLYQLEPAPTRSATRIWPSRPCRLGTDRGATTAPDRIAPGRATPTKDSTDRGAETP